MRGIRALSSSHTFRRLLKTHCFDLAFPSVPPSGSHKRLRFGLWPTLHFKGFRFTYKAEHDGRPLCQSKLWSYCSPFVTKVQQIKTVHVREWSQFSTPFPIDAILLHVDDICKEFAKLRLSAWDMSAWKSWFLLVPLETTVLCFRHLWIQTPKLSMRVREWSRFAVPFPNWWYLVAC